MEVRDGADAHLKMRDIAVDWMNKAQQWPTVRAITGGAESAERKQELGRTESGGGDLQAAAQGFSHPAPASKSDGQPSSNAGLTSRRRLNPLFVRWLMGWPLVEPIDGTGSASSATAWCQFRQHMRSHFLRLVSY
jgi:hypothetical protein